MKTYFVLGGYGTMGKVCVIDLFETTKDNIVIAGRDGKKAKALAKSFKSSRVKGVKTDANNHTELVAIFKDSDVVVNCSQYYFNLNVMKACLEAKCSYLDLGGLFHMTLKQLKLNKSFQKSKITAVLGCGSTPGITNVLASSGSKYFDKINDIHISFASYDNTDYKNMPFVVPYSAYTLIDEFSDKPAVFTKGKLKFVKPLSGKRKEVFPDPIGVVNSFHTLHSELATFPSSFRKKGIKECSFSVTFPDEFVDKIKFLIDVGLGKNKNVNLDGKKVNLKDITAKELNRLIPDEKILFNDMEYIRVKIKGIKSRKNFELTLDCIAKSDNKKRLAAGDIDTGVPPSVIAQMIANKKITKKGVFAPENCVNEDYFFNEIKKRNMEIFIEKRWKL